ncbi:MAG: polysaccharide biosynthesis protein [Maricaulaceae bacterium]|nr:polysaccharide biosynthesis protein [Maricaulaceae bacterium]
MSTPPPPQRNPRLRSGTPLTMAGVFIYDVMAGAAAMGLAVHLRYQFEPINAPDGVVAVSAGVFALACAISFFFFGLHKAVWRYTSLNDVSRALQAIVLANLLFIPMLFAVNRLDGVPRTSLLIEAPILIALMLTARAAAAAWRTGELRAAFRREDRSKDPAILVGDAAALNEALRALTLRNGASPFRVKGLIELSGVHDGRAIRGFPVVGGADKVEAALKRLARDEKTTPRLVVADPRPDPVLLQSLVRAASRAKAKLSRARPPDGANGAASAFSPVEAADLLNRAPRAPSLDLARRLIAGRRVLVTGAGGTIGSELVRIAAGLKPEKLILFDSSEKNLYDIDLQMNANPAAPPWRPVLGDVRDRARLNRVFAEERPQVVLHTAALKHVPLMEANAAEAVMTNVYGVIQTIEAAREGGAELVALISTDKAVNPASFMGASKRAAELYARAAAAGMDKPRLCVVRFGNVLGSAGSVVPHFESLIEDGKPVTVTHADATRYFMTVNEACGLVLDSAALSAGDQRHDGALYVFDMGDPVPIETMARQLLRLRGRDPDAGDAIVFTGLRAGEKLHEELFYDHEALTETAVEGVLAVQGPPPDAREVLPRIEMLVAAARAGDEVAVHEALTALIPEFRPLGGPARAAAALSPRPEA